MDLSEALVPSSQVSLEVIQLGIPARSTLGSAAFTTHRVASLAQNESPTLEINF